MIQVTDSAKEYLKKVGKPNVSLAVKGGDVQAFNMSGESLMQSRL